MHLLLARAARLPRTAVVLLALGLALLVRALDALPGVALSFAILHVLPVALAAWFGGRAAGGALAVAAALLWLTLDLMEPRAGRGPAIPYLDALLRAGVLLALALLLCALREALEQARADPLTGVLNRQAFREAAELELDRAGRYDRPLTLACADLDALKDLNLRYGEQAGDTVLGWVARSLRKTVRGSDVVGRTGDDEFAVLFAETGAEAAAGALAKLRKELQRLGDRGHLPTTVTLAATTWPHPPATFDALLGRTRDALLAAKREKGGPPRHEVVDDGRRGADQG